MTSKSAKLKEVNGIEKDISWHAEIRKPLRQRRVDEARAQAQTNKKSTVRRVDRTEYESLIRSMTPDQSQAAEIFLQLYHGGQRGVPAMDCSRIVVDGGKIGFEIPDNVIDCQNKLGRAASSETGIGKYQFDIIHMYVAEDYTSRQVAHAFNLEWNSRSGDRLRFAFRLALTQLALHFGITKRKDHSRSSYYWNDGG